MSIGKTLSLASIRALPAEKKWLGVSACVSLVLIWMSKSQWGDLLDTCTDHLHHALATWVFVHIGLDAYRIPLGVSYKMVSFPPGGAFWPQFPVAYPPGMFAVFLPLSLFGAYVPVTTAVFGKIAVGYLTAITHGTLWKMSSLVKRLESKPWLFVFAFTWVYLLRVSLNGFYDGVWLLAGALGISAFAEKNSHRPRSRSPQPC
jgi:hypothetical protein